jgi:hypothetical protein
MSYEQYVAASAVSSTTSASVVHRTVDVVAAEVAEQKIQLQKAYSAHNTACYAINIEGDLNHEPSIEDAQAAIEVAERKLRDLQNELTSLQTAGSAGSSYAQLAESAGSATASSYGQLLESVGVPYRQ